MQKYDTTVFRQNLDKLIRSNALNPTQLAYKLGLPPMTISRYLSGDRIPSIDYAAMIARYFHVTLDWLLGVPVDQKTVTEASKIASLYMLASNDDKAVINSILQNYAKEHNYLDYIDFADRFCSLGGFNKMDIINLITKFEEMPRAFTRLMPVSYSVRFYNDIAKDAAIITLSTEWDAARIILCPGRIRNCMTANGMFPNELNTFLEQMKPFVDVRESKHIPYDNEMAKYYLSVPMIIEKMDEFTGYIAKFLEDILG